MSRPSPKPGAGSEPGTGSAGKGLAAAAGLAQLCGFQRYLIDSFFLTLPHSPNPHMHFSCSPLLGKGCLRWKRKREKIQNTTNHNQNLLLFLPSPEVLLV